MSVFEFKYFSVKQSASAQKVGTDSMILGALLPQGVSGHALDIGTGTGVLALMAAQRNPDLQILAVELDEQAAKEAEGNFKASVYDPFLTVRNGNVLDFQSDTKFDLIFSNPPFFVAAYLSDDERKNRARHTDELPFKDLLSKAFSLMTETADFYLILPVESEVEIIELARRLGFYLRKKIVLFAKPNKIRRLVFCFTKEECETKHSSLLIRNEDGTYSDEYKTLTKEFHNKAL